MVSRLFSRSSRPIYLLDASRRIIFCNQALAAWVNQSIDGLLGLRCSYSIPSGSLLSELANQLSPPLRTLDESSYQSSLTVHVNGTPSHRNASFYLLNDDIDTSSTLVIVDAHDAAQNIEDVFDSDSLHQQLIEARQRWNASYSIDQLVGQSPAMQQVRRQVRLATRDRCHVVIVGNTGSGRETIAHTIYRERAGERAILVPLSGSVLDVELIEVALQSFQYERKELSRETATLLLLDVDQLPIDAQGVLIDFLTKSDSEVETISTTQTPLSQLSDQHLFRSDLAHHLANLEIRLPLLCDRLEDIPLVAQWFVEKSNLSSTKQLGGFTAEAMEALLRYRWPREVSELQEVVQ